MDLAVLDQLCVWMRLNGATSARIDGIELTLGPPIAPVGEIPQPPAPSAEDIERSDLDTLLFGTGADATAFLRGRSA